MRGDAKPATAAKRKGAVAVYARTSSNKKAPQLKASQARQLAAAKTAAGLAGKGAKVVKEVASGSRDVEKRQLLKAIQSGQFSHVYCESPRAVARNVMIQEMLYETSKPWNPDRGE